MVCQNTVRARGFGQILCRALLPDGEIPQSMMGKAAACCGHQYFCPLKQTWEHTSAAAACKIKLGGGDGYGRPVNGRDERAGGL